MERGGKVDVQTCSRDESCQSDSLHETFTSSSPQPDVCDEKLTLAAPTSNAIWALSSFNFGVRLINWMKCGVSNAIWLKKVIDKWKR